MTKQTRRKFSSAFKAKVALEAIKEKKTLSELAKQFEVNPVMISQWKAAFLENMAVAFEKGKSKDEADVDTQELYAQIGQQKVEIEFLKKQA
jgi:transposase-like protein